MQGELKLTIRELQHVQSWISKLSLGHWTKADSKLALKIEAMKRQIGHENYARKKSFIINLKEVVKN